MKNQNESTPQMTPPPVATDTVENVVDLNAVERLQAENDELRETLQMRDARDELTAALTGAGARSPGLLFESAISTLQFGPDGKLANAAAVLDRLRKTFPEQFGSDAAPVSIDAGAGGPPRPQITKAALAKMTATEIAALNWDDVKSVLSNG